MGFSQEATVKMADGSWKNINLIKVGDYVLTKHGSSVRVMANYKQTAQDCVSFERGGSVTTIYCTPDQKFESCYTTTGNKFVHGYFTPAQIDARDAYLKNSKHIFGTENNVAFNNYNGTVVSKDVWSLDVSDSTKSFLVNTVLAIEDGRV